MNTDLCSITEWRIKQIHRKRILEETASRIEPLPSVRTLKIEADGDFWRGLIKPKIRLIGRRLERAGFRPGNRVQVTCIAPGVIELRSTDTSTMNETEQPS